jgi:hypothetical protein
VKPLSSVCCITIDVHRGRGGGIKVYPSSEIFAKLVNKNAIKHQKGVPSPQNFYNPYIPSLPKFGKNLFDPPPRISNRVHLCVSLIWLKSLGRKRTGIRV